eukprot:TRINITY_DN1944_c0_g2_i1.p1 TRINITY_DN1944_c0_g2~~TRINITY_DN1944_c0_g2_i1.p1  ORF type:complete len:213 (-),score=50.09 TRINITY_DN1944_c0_g2_i1:478-1071(-)
MEEMSTKYFEKVLSLLPNNIPEIFQIDLTDHDIGPEKALRLSQALKGNTYLRVLDMYGNPLGAEGGKIIGEAIQDLPQLEELDLAKCQLGDEGAKSIALGLKQNTQLTQLDLSGNNISDEGLEAISDSLKNKENLTELLLHDNNITEPEPLIQALQGKSLLSGLWLNRNKISSENLLKLKHNFHHLNRLQIDIVNHN